jgi:nucleotide-binding universal stress UspA family protein
MSSRSHRRPHRVVVGYDGSQPARDAVSWAAERVGRHGLVIIVNAGRGQPDWLAAPGLDRLLRDRLLYGHALIDELFLEAGDDLLTTRCETEVIDDLPARALAAAARRWDADEIVVGSRHRARVRAHTGSVARELLQIADRPVVVVPEHGQVTARSDRPVESVQAK